MIYGLWHGGDSYSFGSIETDLEQFASMAQAVDAFRSRRDHGSWLRQPFVWANGEVSTAYTPTVTESSFMHLWLSDPTDSLDPYPDRVITVGPRGGVTLSRT